MKDARGRLPGLGYHYQTVSPTVTVTVTVTVAVALRHPSLSHWHLHCSELTESDSCQPPEARPGSVSRQLEWPRARVSAAAFRPQPSARPRPGRWLPTESAQRPPGSLSHWHGGPARAGVTVGLSVAARGPGPVWAPGLRLMPNRDRDRRQPGRLNLLLES